MNARRLVDLLEDTRMRGRGKLSRDAGDLLNGMERASWRVLAGIHRGGRGGGGRPADSREHVTLRADGRVYHLRFHRNGRRLIQITR